MTEDAISPQAARLVEGAARVSDPRIVAIPGGANNRVYRVDGGPDPMLLKVYFRDAGDPRDRLAAEFDFLSCAWEGGIRCVPQPLGRDDEAGMGLYEYIDGERFAPGSVDERDVARAATFVEELNAPAARDRARDLPAASEAFFSIGELIDHVSARVDRLRGFALSDEVDAECANFVAERLIPDWDALAAATADRVSAEPALGDTLSQARRIVSPSDFGFHNALRAKDGLRFIDFEYAGWDDPAKLVCDFFCQVAVPVPGEHFDRVLAAAIASAPDADELEERVRLLLPIHRMKWCCILLNDFVDPGRKRRVFALGEAAARERRAGQLEKLRQFVDPPRAAVR